MDDAVEELIEVLRIDKGLLFGTQFMSHYFAHYVLNHLWFV